MQLFQHISKRECARERERESEIEDVGERKKKEKKVIKREKSGNETRDE